MSARTVDISPEHLAIVRQILDRIVPPGTKVWAFGSRVVGTAYRWSDLDLVIDAGRPLSRTEEVQLEVEFEESALPFKVDVVDWYRISDEFQRAIRDQMTSLPETNGLTVRKGG